jgi:hypothetical protein
MVRHGTNKKRRSGRTGRTKLKNRSYSKFKPPQIQDSVIKSHWDPTKSASVNLQNIGLNSTPNSDIICKNQNRDLIQEQNKHEKNGTPKIIRREDCKAIELYDIPDSDIIPSRPLKTHLPVSVDNQKYIVKCFAKYGDDYRKMSRDIKVNNMQHTENVLRKMGARFLLLSDNERRVDIPEKIQKLII